MIENQIFIILSEQEAQRDFFPENTF